MKLDIVIPTLDRRDKLQVCINSILKSAKTDNVRLVIFFGSQSELEYFKPQFCFIENVVLNYLPEYRVPTFWNNYLADMKADALCYLNDDVELFDDTLDIVMEDFAEKFPDTDGVLGLNQVNIHDSHKVESAFGVIGTKYADRFPYRQVWCPDYHRFYCDWELWKHAKDMGRFFFCESARINHYHPSLNHKWEDTTHTAVRTFLKQDKLTFQKRQALSLLWGNDYKLINM